MVDIEHQQSETQVTLTHAIHLALPQCHEMGAVERFGQRVGGCHVAQPVFELAPFGHLVLQQPLGVLGGLGIGVGGLGQRGEIGCLAFQRLVAETQFDCQPLGGVARLLGLVRLLLGRMLGLDERGAGQHAPAVAANRTTQQQPGPVSQADFGAGKRAGADRCFQMALGRGRVAGRGRDVGCLHDRAAQLAQCRGGVGRQRPQLSEAVVDDPHAQVPVEHGHADVQQIECLAQGRDRVGIRLGGEELRHASGPVGGPIGVGCSAPSPESGNRVTDR